MRQCYCEGQPEGHEPAVHEMYFSVLVVAAAAVVVKERKSVKHNKNKRRILKPRRTFSLERKGLLYNNLQQSILWHAFPL